MTVAAYEIIAKGNPRQTFSYPSTLPPIVSPTVINHGTAIAFGGGIFVTAGHVFDEFINDAYNSEFKADVRETTISNVTITGYANIRPYDPAITQPGNYSLIKPVNDLAVARAPLAVSASQITPLVVFADANVAKN